MNQKLYLFASLLLLGTSLTGCGGTQDVAGSAVAESQSMEAPENTESPEHVEITETPETPEKQELILAGIDFDDSVISAVTAFNQSNDNTTITIRDYGNQSGNTLNEVYKDVADGNAPDMYFMQPASAWPMDALMAQDGFVDLYPYLDNDPAISRDDVFRRF